MKILGIILLLYLALCHGQHAAAATTPAATNETSMPDDPSNQASSAASSSSSSEAAAAAVASFSPIYEAHANEFIEIGTQRMKNIYNLKRELFNDLTKTVKYNSNTQEIGKQEIDRDYHNLVHELATNLSVIPVKYLKDPILRRQVQRLSKLQLHGLKRKEYDQAKQLLSTLQSFVTQPMPCDPLENSEVFCRKGMVPSIIGNVTTTHNEDKLEYFWHRWRQLLNENDRAKSTFIDYVRLFRKAAEYNGHVTPSRTWYLYYETENFQRELEDVVWEIMPLYQELHAYLRHCARLRYGPSLTDETDGAIPAHVMEQMILQDWYKSPVFKMPIPNHTLPTVTDRIGEVIVSPVKVIDKADDFFVSLGLDPLPKNISRRIAETGGAGERECRSEVYYFPPSVALRYCTKLDHKVLMQMHGHTSDLQYNIYKKELPLGLDNEPCPGFGSAIAEAAVVSAGTPRHMRRLNILGDETLPFNTSYNRLFRMGIHTLLAIPQYFINDRYLVDVMDGRVAPNEFNCAYWKLQYKYAGVRPPNRRSERNFDPDYRFYRGLNPEKSSTIKFISEVMGFQFLRSFCLASGEYKPGNKQFPLYSCDFYGSKKAGDMIKKMMKLGATKHWRDVLEVATDERRLSGKGVVEYFGPLYMWLKEKNKELGLIKGWDDDIQCTNS